MLQVEGSRTGQGSVFPPLSKCPGHLPVDSKDWLRPPPDAMH